MEEPILFVDGQADGEALRAFFTARDVFAGRDDSFLVISISGRGRDNSYLLSIPLMLIIVSVLMFCSSLVYAEGMQLPSDAAIEAQIAKSRSRIDEKLPKIDGSIPKVGTVYGDVPADQVITSPKAIEDVMRSMQNFDGGRPAKKVGSDLMIFASLSMPRDVLHELSRQAKEAGGVVVLRGVLSDGWVATMKEARAINQGAGAAWLINPAMFKKFKVTTVPVFVLADASQIVPSDEGCAPDVAFASVTGAVSVEQALNIIKSRGKPEFAKMAEARINKIRGK